MPRGERPFRQGAVVTFAVMVISSCAFQRAEEATAAQAPMVGMPKEQVLSCMGAPASSARAGNTEVWNYESGDGRTDTFGTFNAVRGSYSVTAFGSSTSTSRYCKISLVMTSGVISRVNYAGPTGGLLTQGEQCGYAVHNCVAQAHRHDSASTLPIAGSPGSEAIPAAAADRGLPTAPAGLSVECRTPSGEEIGFVQSLESCARLGGVPAK